MTNKKNSVTNKKVKLTQIASAIGRKQDQRKTLIGLGLNKMNKTSTLQDTDAVRGMIKKVNHLISVEFVK